MRFGPATVGGAVNLLSAPIPQRRRMLLDVAGGSFGYGKAHLGYGDSREHVGWWVEGVGLRSDGFKELDGGGPTGFTKWEALAKLRLNTAPRRKVMHALVLRADLSDERSYETYTGLADKDVKETPWRRYRATADDLLTWRRLGLKATYTLRWSERWRLRADVYRHDFQRTWGKLSGFASGKSIASVLDNPTSGGNSVLYDVLTGQSDSTDASEGLLFGTNARRFISMGVQAQVNGSFSTGQLAGREIAHELVVGLRLHNDAVDRLALEETRLMRQGALERGQERTLRDVTGGALALAGWAQDTVQLGEVRLSAGLRMEHIRNTWQDHLTPASDSDDAYTAFVPGLGLLWEPVKGLGLLAGVNRGFSPVSPGQQAGVLPESSWNYELGARWNRRRVRAEVIGFFNDYSNIKGTCSFSAGCGIDEVGLEFNGGRVWIWGVEATAGALLRPSRKLRVPVSVTYTLTQSEFQTAFTSANPQWGQVAVGDALPYVPVHQLALNSGLRWWRVDLGLSARIASAMRDSAGQGAGDRFTDMTAVFDAALSVDLGRWGKVYVNARNLLDSAQVVSFRPFGARPGMRRQLMVGYKFRN